MKFCEWCSDSFVPTVSYQIYCSSGCREAATKEKMSENYKSLRRANKKYGKRKCANKDCNNILSVYNDSKYCSSCFFSEHVVEKQLKRIKKESQ